MPDQPPSTQRPWSSAGNHPDRFCVCEEINAPVIELAIIKKD